MLLTSSSPEHGAEGVALQSTIVLTFDAIVDQTTIEDAIILSRRAETNDGSSTLLIFGTTFEIIDYTYTVDDSNGYSIITITPSAPFLQGTKYLVTVATTLVDDATGEDFLENPYMVEFETSETGVETPPETPSTTVGYIPPLDEVYTPISGTVPTSALTVLSASPQDETFGYSSIDEVAITLSEEVNTIGVLTVQVINLETMSTTTYVEDTDYTVNITGAVITITLTTALTADNTKLAITLMNVTSSESTNTLYRYDYEIVTNFNPLYVTMNYALMEVMGINSSVDRYYLAHILYYMSREAQAMSQECADSPLLSLYRMRWSMSAAIAHILTREIQNSNNMFATEKKLAYLTIKKSVSSALAPTALNTALAEMKRYEVPLTTCGELLPDAHMKPTSAMIHGNSNNVLLAGRGIDLSNDDPLANTRIHQDDDDTRYFVRTYSSGGSLLGDADA